MSRYQPLISQMTADEVKATLVPLLQEAASLEHCLLNSYLYTACSLKNTPLEFEDGGRRAAVQFENVRLWKTAILAVCHEEMRHLHLVQCLLRSLGELPHFGLPPRNPEGDWLIANWEPHIDATVARTAPRLAGTLRGLHAAPQATAGDGVTVPVTPLTHAFAAKLAAYESSDSVQDAGMFGPEMTALYEKLAGFELEFRLESILYNMRNEANYAELRDSLRAIFTELSPTVTLTRDLHLKQARLGTEALPTADAVITFQSIGTFYTDVILPLFQQAFEHKLVVNSNIDLNNELLDPAYAAEGFLPIGPAHRSSKYSAQVQSVDKNPLANFESVQTVIDSIVNQGEGFPDFKKRADDFLAYTSGADGVKKYFNQMLLDQNSAPTDPAYYEGQLLRLSHLYQFLMIWQQIGDEAAIMEAAGQSFAPARTPLEVSTVPDLSTLAGQIPLYFNASYLVMVGWLSRIYEVRDLQGDKARRQAIEMLASWPLMSLATRPMLEMASFFPVDRTALYRFTPSDADYLAPVSHTLMDLYGTWIGSGPNIPEFTGRAALNDEIDAEALKVLTAIAAWAKGVIPTVEASTVIGDNDKRTILARLKTLLTLEEFANQFDFRVHGGYSDRLPDLEYQAENAEAATKYAEDPTTFGGKNSLFQNSVVVAIRFGGHGLIQLATDPDPTYDEVGSSGTQMLHRADIYADTIGGPRLSSRRLDASMFWKDEDASQVILREPKQAIPFPAITSSEVTLCIAGAPGTVSVGYEPLQVMQSSGAVQTNGVQQQMTISGLSTLVTYPYAGTLTLEPKDGANPALVGLNHLIWRDGEPIDPFVLTVDNEIFGGAVGREVYNEDRTLEQMTAYQRARSQRFPVGFDSSKNTPAWARDKMFGPLRQSLDDPSFPAPYLAQRAKTLGGQVDALLKATPLDQASQTDIDRIVSLAQRMADVSLPRGTTVAWLKFLLHYGHTVSGDMTNTLALPGTTPRPKTAKDRNAPNSRWLIDYTIGLMDTDALAGFFYGTLYIPLNADFLEKTQTFSRSWSVPAAVADALTAYGAVFTAPFWAPYEFKGADERWLAGTGAKRHTPLLMRPSKPSNAYLHAPRHVRERIDQSFLPAPQQDKVIERLTSSTTSSYDYELVGFADVSAFTASFAVTETGDTATLTWSVTFTAGTNDALIAAAKYFGTTADTMGATLTAHFAPKTSP